MSIAAMLCAAGLALAVPSAPSGDLKFAPAAGSSVHASFIEHTTWKLDRVERSDERANPWPKFQLAGEASRTLAIVDRFDEIQGGAVSKRSREFESTGARSVVSMTVGTWTSELTLSRASPLAKARVVFGRAAADKPAVATLAGEAKLDPRLLGGLRDDTDLLALLPSEHVQQGASWSVDAARLVEILAPGGELGLLPERLTSDDVFDPTEKATLAMCAVSENTNALHGSARLTWSGTTKDDERELATILVEVEFDSRTPQGARVASWLVSSGRATKRTQFEAVFACSTHGKGELTWDITHARAASLVLDLESEISVRESWHEQLDGADTPLADELTLSATTELAAQFEAR
jgi:hypothetical protein